MPPTEEQERKFINRTPGWIGVSKLDGDNKWTSLPVEPNGGAVYLTAAEERKTAEAPFLASDNPFVKEWEEPVEWDGDGYPTRTVTRTGMLVLSDEPARPIASDRFIPTREEAAMTPTAEVTQPASGEEVAKPDEKVEEITGAPELPPQPPVEGQPSENEIVGSPGAVEANIEALAARKSTAEQPTKGVAIPV